MIGVNRPVCTTHTLRRGPARDNSSINKKWGDIDVLKCVRGCCYGRPHPNPVFVAMYSKMSSHVHRIRSTLLPTTPLLPSFCVFPDYRFVCLVWRVIIISLSLQFSFYCAPSPKKIGNTVHILHLGSPSDSLSCSLQYMAWKLFQLRKASTSNHYGICPTCDAQFFDREFSKRRGRRR